MLQITNDKSLLKPSAGKCILSEIFFFFCEAANIWDLPGILINSAI